MHKSGLHTTEHIVYPVRSGRLLRHDISDLAYTSASTMRSCKSARVNRLG